MPEAGEAEVLVEQRQPSRVGPTFGPGPEALKRHDLTTTGTVTYREHVRSAARAERTHHFVSIENRLQAPPWPVEQLAALGNCDRDPGRAGGG